MAKRRKPPPETSQLLRDRLLAYSRRQRSSAEGSDGDDDDKAGDAKVEPNKDEPKKDEPRESRTTAEMKAQPAVEPPPLEPPPAKAEAPAPPARSRADTLAMPAELLVGAPPEMPRPGAAEAPTRMPGPRDIGEGNPTDPAAPPGVVPAGDSRSMRRGTEFALIYRRQTSVISRFGTLGTRGQWRVVEYPTSASASNAYAKEVSRFVSEGFTDYRE